MRAIRLLVGVLLFVTISVSQAIAQNNRSFVSGLGSDSNPCTRTAPCRTFARALLQTNAGGEVVALDSAGFGSFNVAKPITVEAPGGVYAGVSVSAGDAVDISASPSDTVVLRGLTVTSQGTSGHGIVFNSGGSLHLEGCVVTGFSSGTGVFFHGPGKLHVKDSIIRGNVDGVDILPASGAALALLDNVRLEGNVSFGLASGDGSKVTVRNSVASNNGLVGFNCQSFNSGLAELNIQNCVVSGNGSAGIFAGTGTAVAPTVRVSDSTVTDNLIGLQNFQSTSVVLSRGNNTIEGNGMDTSGMIGTYSPK
jgi:hypothetical protein